MTRRFRKKPVVIEAVQWTGDNWSHIAAFVGERLSPASYAGWPSPNADRTLRVPTLEGEHIASPGDWIIRGVKGELYPCKPDIFAVTYEAA
jgi:hypothetical protein